MGFVNTHYKRGVEADADTSDGMSGFFGDASVLSGIEDLQKGFGYLEDGLGVPIITSDGFTGPYQMELTSGGGSPKFGSTSYYGGALIIQTGTTDSDEVLAQFGGAEAANCRISDTGTQKKALFYEISLLPSLITATQWEGFFGLCEPFSLASDGLLEDAGGLDGARDFIGFFKPEGDAGLVDFVYQKGGQALQTKLNGWTTLSTTTPKKLGFVVDWNAPADQIIRVFVDGVLQATSAFVGVSATDIAASTFPDAIMMTPTFNVKAATGAVQTVKIPHWGYFQEK